MFLSITPTCILIFPNFLLTDLLTDWPMRSQEGPSPLKSTNKYIRYLNLTINKQENILLVPYSKRELQSQFDSIYIETLLYKTVWPLYKI